MSENVITAAQLTKDYGHGRGIFDVSFDVRRGEVFGFIGTNGSGKTTTIRNMMGFIHPDAGEVSVLGMNAWAQSIDLKPFVSYVPGEIAFPKLPTGTAFLKLQAEYLGVSDFTYMNKLIRLFQLDTTANLARMSKGMKQKTALVAALMGDREILILDEPTTGLDPLMRDVFLDLIREEKAKGKTIFMSSHIFEEIEEVCDRAAMIRDGRLVDVLDVYALRHEEHKHFVLVFASEEERIRFEKECDYAICESKEQTCHVAIGRENVKRLLKHLKNHQLLSLSEEHETLEHRFKTVFRKGE